MCCAAVNGRRAPAQKVDLTRRQQKEKHPWTNVNKITAKRLNALLQLLAILLLVMFFMVVRGCIFSPPPFNP